MEMEQDRLVGLGQGTRSLCSTILRWKEVGEESEVKCGSGWWIHGVDTLR